VHLLQPSSCQLHNRQSVDGACDDACPIACSQSCTKSCAHTSPDTFPNSGANAESDSRADARAISLADSNSNAPADARCATDFTLPNDISDCVACNHDTAADDSHHQYDHNAAPH
jgi:hypothetical protein